MTRSNCWRLRCVSFAFHGFAVTIRSEFTVLFASLLQRLVESRLGRLRAVQSVDRLQAGAREKVLNVSVRLGHYFACAACLVGYGMPRWFPHIPAPHAQGVLGRALDLNVSRDVSSQREEHTVRFTFEQMSFLRVKGGFELVYWTSEGYQEVLWPVSVLPSV